jgi:hypothetical protein
MDSSVIILVASNFYFPLNSRPTLTTGSKHLPSQQVIVWEQPRLLENPPVSNSFFLSKRATDSIWHRFRLEHRHSRDLTFKDQLSTEKYGELEPVSTLLKVSSLAIKSELCK